jgi:PAS domain S-box-containing protein
MKEELLITSVNQTTIGIAHHRIQENTHDVPRFHYEFLEANKAFGTILGISFTSLAGRTLAEVLPRMSKDRFNWLELYNEVAINGGTRQADFFSDHLEQWYTLHISATAPGYLTTMILEGRRHKSSPAVQKNDNRDELFPQPDRLALVEQQLAEYREQIFKRKKMLKSYFDSNPIATFVWVYKNNEFYLDEVNQTALRLSQNKIRTFIGLSAKAVYHDVPFIYEQINDCFHHDKVIEFEMDYQTRYSGRYEWIRFKLVRLDPDKVLAFSEVITRQKKAEQDLIIAREKASVSARKYRALYLNAPLAFHSLDQNGFIIDINPMWIKVMGYDCAEIIGTKFSSFLHPSCAVTFNEAFETFKQRGFISNAEFKIRKKEGDYIDILYEGSVGYSAEGDFLQTYCVFTNITAQKQAEQALLHSERLLNTSQHLSKVGGWEWDSQSRQIIWTKETYHIHDMNPRGLPVGNYEHIKKSSICYNPSDRRKILRAFKLCVRQGIAYDFEVPFTSLAGRQKWVRTIGEAIIEDGKIIKVIGNIIDITERKLIEQERLQSEELTRQIAVARDSLRFKQNFLANMSHEMRSPLTGILGMAEVLNQTALTDIQKDYLNTIIQSGGNLRTIINNVLDFSKLEAGKMQLRKSIFPIKNIAVFTQRFFRSICRKPIDFHFTIDPELPDFIMADDTRLSQIIHNLVFNAVKFTEKGNISLHCQLVQKQTQDKSLIVKILVEDTGRGIDKDIQRKLFIPFSQIEDNDTRHFEGTGLGLSICKELVKLHDGEIGVESTLGQGSTFWFTFKAEEARPHHRITHRKPAKVPQDIKSLRILLAEDKIVNQKVVKLMLSSIGHQVTIASNGLEALEMFDPTLFDLVLMDIQMPLMDGIMATQKIREKFSTLPPIIGLSANAFEGDREKYMSQGLDEYLIKPLNTADFNSVIAKFLK